MKYKVINTNILVELIEDKPKEDEIISSEVFDNVVKGRVKEIGTGINRYGNRVPMEVRPDSLVWFPITQAFPLSEEGNLFVVPQESIIVIEED